MVAISGRGIYWQLIDAGGPNKLTIAVSSQTPESLKDILRQTDAPAFLRPPEGDGNGAWIIDLDLMREIAHAEGTSSGFPSWVGGKVSVEPSAESWGARFVITPEMRA